MTAAVAAVTRPSGNGVEALTVTPSSHRVVIAIPLPPFRAFIRPLSLSLLFSFVWVLVCVCFGVPPHTVGFPRQGRLCLSLFFCA